MSKQVNTKPCFAGFCWLLLSILLCYPILGCKDEIAPNHADATSDFDLDAVPDHFDLDDDNDGILDEIETTADIDGDKVGNHHDRDSDGDGIPDLIEATGVDKDGDGILDPWDEWGDDNKNGLHDEYENGPLVEVTTVGGKKQWQSHHQFGYILLDQDSDGIPNFWDKDSDNDGQSDKQEAGNRLVLAQMVDTNADGFDDRLVGHVYTQGDKIGRSGHPEFTKLDLSLYASIHTDGSFGLLNGIPDIDDNGNGIPNFLDLATE